FAFVERNGVPFWVYLNPGTRVRIAGVIAVDPDHDEEPIGVPTDDPDRRSPGLLVKTAEIHPVYAIDLVQDFGPNGPLRRGADLKGVWHADDVGTYYLRQVNQNTLWWLGLSRDQGRTFANVFQGTINGNTIRGEWADIPVGIGGARSSGLLTLVGDGK